MHRLRRAAHAVAWENDSMNPFAKFGRHSKIHDVEEGQEAEQNGAASTEQPRGSVDARPSQSDNPRGVAQERTDDASDTIVNQRPSDESNAAQGLPRKRKTLPNQDNIDEEQPLEPHKEEDDRVKPNFTTWSQIRATIFNSWINVLLVAVPAGIVLGALDISPISVFVVNFIAIVPLAAMLSFATEEIALRTGETIGGLLNATFGNAVELIVSIIALAKGEVLVVQTSLIGSILSNLLLVMGMCFFFGGWNRIQQNFNITVAQTATSLLILAVGSLIIPTAFHSWSTAGDSGITPLSRGTAVMLLITYGCYLYFQLKSHVEMYNAPSDKGVRRNVKVVKGDTKKNIAQIGLGASGSTGVVQADHNVMQSPEDDREEPQLHFVVACITLVISTVFVAICAEYMVDGISAVTEEGVSVEFVGLILLPIVGNAAEHATAVTVAVKDKMDLAIGVAVGSSMQIALLVLPLMVIIGWFMGNDDMTLYFDGFQVAMLFVACLLVNFIISDGKSHWLEGVTLEILYLTIAVAAWFYPASGDLVG